MRLALLILLISVPAFSYDTKTVIINGIAYGVDKVELKNGMVYVNTANTSQRLCTPVRVNWGGGSGGSRFGGTYKYRGKKSEPSFKKNPFVGNSEETLEKIQERVKSVTGQYRRTYSSPPKKKFQRGPIDVNSLEEAEDKKPTRKPASEDPKDLERLKYQ